MTTEGKARHGETKLNRTVKKSRKTWKDLDKVRTHDI